MPRKSRVKRIVSKKSRKKRQKGGLLFNGGLQVNVKGPRTCGINGDSKQTVRALNLEIKNIGGENVLVATGLNNLLTVEKKDGCRDGTLTAKPAEAVAEGAEAAASAEAEREEAEAAAAEAAAAEEQAQKKQKQQQQKNKLKKKQQQLKKQKQQQQLKQKQQRQHQLLKKNLEAEAEMKN